MKIHGIGIISSVGRGIKGFDEALLQDPVASQMSVYSSINDKAIPVFSVDDSLLKDRDVLKNSRRADRFCKMAALASWDAMADSGIEIKEDEKVGVIVATAFGPHRTTFNFLDDILDYGEAGVSPTTFSHSVHNAAASYITSALNINGPVSTLTNFCFSFQEACKLADSWMSQGRCKYVLVGTVDELSSAMEYICDQKLDISEDGQIHPFGFSSHAKTVPGEGSAFFLLSKSEESAKYCSISYGDEYEEANVCILESDGTMQDESVYGNVDVGDAELFNCSSLFGSIMSGTSFHCAAGALILKNGRCFSKYTHGLTQEEKKSLANVVCLKYGWDKDLSIMSLTK